MYLTDLPEEILVIIIKKLDLKSVYNLYETCNHLKYIVCTYAVVKTGSLALNTMATAKTFKLKFLKDISSHLQNLDLRGVNDLNKTSLLMAVKRMTCLKSLDVTYTNITIVDLIEVYKMCSTLKKIACNFVFGKENDIKIPQKVLIESQNLFQNFDNIHFVGNAGNLLYSNLVMWILHKAHLQHLQLTVAENQSTVFELIEEIEEVKLKVNLKAVSIYVLNEWKLTNPGFGSFLNIPNLLTAEDKYEFIVIINVDCSTHIIYVSTVFKNFFNDYFKLESKCVKNIDFLNYVANAVVMLWNKSETIFDETFFSELKNKLVDLFPYCIKDNSITVPDHFNEFLYRISSQQIKTSNSSLNTSDFKRRRLGPSPYVLNYDTVFSKKDKVHLTLLFHDCANQPIVLSPNNQYLRKLTYLSLIGNVRYSAEFFNVMFRCCEQLETLNVEASMYSPCSLSIARNIPLSKSVKNLRLVDRRIDFRILFSSLSQCFILENIHIMDVSQDHNEPSDPSILYEKCKNLYCLFILATMCPTAKSRRMHLFKKLKERYNKNHLYIQLCTKYMECRYNYDPYIDVFKLNSIKPQQLFYCSFVIYFKFIMNTPLFFLYNLRYAASGGKSGLCGIRTQ